MSSLNPKYGGPTSSVPNICSGLAKEGVDVTLVTYTESRPWENNMIKDGVKIIEYDKPVFFLREKMHLALKELLKQDDDADIYHYHGAWLPCNHWCAVAARRKGKKYVLNPRGDLETYRINYDLWKKIKKMFVWYLYAYKDTKNASCIIATSKQEACAVRRLSVKAPIAIIPNGIDIGLYPKEVVHTTRGKRIVLFLSRVNPIKGLELLVEAWNNLPLNLRSVWELHIAGNSDPSDYVNKLKDLITSYGLDDSIKILGPITGEAKMQKYMNSDLFILPTFNENFGNVVAEALMCECPVITTKNAPWEVIEEEKCGWWIDLSVENIMKTLIEAMSLTDEERIALGRKGRQCIINHFSSESVAKKTKAVYQWVLGEIEKPQFIETM